MRLETTKYLQDIRAAADLIAAFTAGKSFTDYAAEQMLRSAVERQFEIIGEAMGRLAESIPRYRSIIAFRNVLIHGYASVDDRIVWGIVEGELPALRGKTAELLGLATGTAEENTGSPGDAA
jgi:uncharacterized protein with HEPN domain